MNRHTAFSDLQRGMRVELAAIDRREASLTDSFSEGLLSADAFRLALQRLANDRAGLTLTKAPTDLLAARQLDQAIARAMTAWDIHVAMPLSEQRQLLTTVFAELILSPEGIADYQLNQGLSATAA